MEARAPRPRRPRPLHAGKPHLPRPPHRASDLSASASASGVVTKREEDERYAFVEIDCRLEVELERELPGDELHALVTKSERDCFVGASLTAKPSYRWRVNGSDYSY